jgi:hypothetical protein
MRRERSLVSSLTVLVVALCSLVCSLPARAQPCDYDFNNDGVFPSEADLVSFMGALAGSNCVNCDTVDINRNGVFPETEDIVAFFRVLSGSPCEAPTTTPQWTRWVAQWGNDFNTGTVDEPLATVREALIRMRGAEHGTIYILPGTYDMAIQGQYDGVTYGGISAERPLTIMAAQVNGQFAGQRPVLVVPNTASAGMRLTNGVNHVRVQGLEIRAGQGQSACIQLLGNAQGLLVEDCVLVGGVLGVSLQGLDGNVVRDVTVRKTIIRDQRNNVGHSQGAYVSAATNVLFEDCVFWNNGNRDTFCQGLYLVHGDYSRTVRNCWIGDPGFAGIQARGGDYVVTGNVFDQCGNGIGVGHPMAIPDGIWTRGTFEDNVILTSKYPYWGITVQRMNCSTVRNNLLIAQNAPGLAIVRQETSPCGNVTNNTVRGWNEPYRNFGPATFGANENIQQPTVLAAPATLPGVNWPLLLSRPGGVWNEGYATATFIARTRALP